MATIYHEPTRRVLAECDGIFEAEALLAVFEAVDPEGVHEGHYGIDPGACGERDAKAKSPATQFDQALVNVLKVVLSDNAMLQKLVHTQDFSTVLTKLPLGAVRPQPLTIQFSTHDDVDRYAKLTMSVLQVREKSLAEREAAFADKEAKWLAIERIMKGGGQ